MAKAQPEGAARRVMYVNQDTGKATVYSVHNEAEARQIAKEERLSGGVGVTVSPSLSFRDAGKLLPSVVPIPDPKELNGMEPAELREILARFGVMPSWTEEIARAMPLAQRAAGLTYSNENVDRILKEATDSSARDLAQRTKDVYRNYMVARITDGNEKQEMIRVSEGDDAVCDICAAKAGFIGTLAEQEEEGLIGTDCLGKDRCRCMYMAVD
jgi:hypothetical protein